MREETDRQVAPQTNACDEGCGARGEAPLILLWLLRLLGPDEVGPAKLGGIAVAFGPLPTL